MTEPTDDAGRRAAQRRRPRPGPPADPGHRAVDARRAQARAAAATPAAARPQVSGSHPDDRDPQLLGSQLDRLVADHGWALELRVRGVFARWPELVGADVGAHCTPESFADGRLVVRTDSTAWATQLTLLAPDARAPAQRGARATAP